MPRIFKSACAGLAALCIGVLPVTADEMNQESGTAATQSENEKQTSSGSITINGKIFTFEEFFVEQTTFASTARSQEWAFENNQRWTTYHFEPEISHSGISRQEIEEGVVRDVVIETHIKSLDLSSVSGYAYVSRMTLFKKLVSNVLIDKLEKEKGGVRKTIMELRDIVPVSVQGYLRDHETEKEQRVNDFVALLLAGAHNKTVRFRGELRVPDFIVFKPRFWTTERKETFRKEGLVWVFTIDEILAIED